jgi:hypothetical protein
MICPSNSSKTRKILKLDHLDSIHRFFVHSVLLMTSLKSILWIKRCNQPIKDHYKINSDQKD